MNNGHSTILYKEAHSFKPEKKVEEGKEKELHFLSSLSSLDVPSQLWGCSLVVSQNRAEVTKKGRENGDFGDHTWFDVWCVVCMYRFVEME
jgi:hypothetical protein